MDSTGMSIRDSTYVPKFHFVGPTDHARDHAKQSYVQREARRLQKWLRCKSLASNTTSRRLARLCPSNARPAAELVSLNHKVTAMPERAVTAPFSPKVSDGSVAVAEVEVPLLTLTAANNDSPPPDKRRFSPFDPVLVPKFGGNLDSLPDLYHAGIISNPYHMSGTEAVLHPMSAISAFALQEETSAYVLFSMTAYDRDIAADQPPSPKTIFYQLKALQLIKQRLQESTNISAGTIMAVVMLWNLEAHWDKPAHSQVHINGLRTLLARYPASSCLPQEVLWVLAWSVSCTPGDFVLPSCCSTVQAFLRTAGPTLSLHHPPARPINELLTFLSSIREHFLLPHIRSQIFSHNSYGMLGETLGYLVGTQTRQNAGFSRGGSQLESSCRTAVLLSVHALLLGFGNLSPCEQEAKIRSELVCLQERISVRGLDREGKIEELWLMVLIAEDTEKIGLSEHIMAVVRMMNLIKQLNITMIEKIGDMLFGYLRGGWDAQYSTSTCEEIIVRLRTDMKKFEAR